MAGKRLNAEIVGIVTDARYRTLRQPVPPTVYVSMAQLPRPAAEINVALRTRGPVSEVMPSLRRTMDELNPKAGYLLRSFAAQVSASVVNERAIAAVSTLFGVLALLLAAAGVYGIVSFSVVQRRPEIGIRMALGATPSGVLRMLFGETAKVVVSGMFAGVVIAAWTAGFTRSLLYGLSAGDAWIYFCSATVLALVAAMATIGPHCERLAAILWRPSGLSSRLPVEVLFVTQCFERVDSNSAARGHPASQQRDEKK